LAGSVMVIPLLFLCRLGRDLEGLPVSGGPQESAQMMVRAMKQYKTDVSGSCLCETARVGVSLCV
jgi:hypothetical protein